MLYSGNSQDYVFFGVCTATGVILFGNQCLSIRKEARRYFKMLLSKDMLVMCQWLIWGMVHKMKLEIFKNYKEYKNRSELAEKKCLWVL